MADERNEALTEHPSGFDNPRRRIPADCWSAMTGILFSQGNVRSAVLQPSLWPLPCMMRPTGRVAEN